MRRASEVLGSDGRVWSRGRVRPQRGNARRAARRGPCRVVLALAAVAACDGSPTASADELDGTVLAGVAEAYREDAARLAVRHVRSRSQGPLPPVEIEQEVAEAFLDALVAVWTLDHPARDSVVERYHVHTLPEPPLRKILVGVRPGTPLAAAWAAGRTRTGQPSADTLIERYDLELVAYRTYTFSSPWAVLRAGRNLDAGALALRFAAVPGVEHASADRTAGDGDDIRGRLEQDALILDFSVGFGDCPAGCLGRHTWSFRIEGGRAEFVGSSGPDPPERGEASNDPEP